MHHRRLSDAIESRPFTRARLQDVLLAAEENLRLRNALEYALETLSEEYQDILQVCAINGSSVAAYANRIGVPSKSAWRRYEHARVALRAAIDRQLGRGSRRRRLTSCTTEP